MKSCLRNKLMKQKISRQVKYIIFCKIYFFSSDKYYFVMEQQSTSWLDAHKVKTVAHIDSHT